ncbi:MAG: hypothetical protein KDD12_05610 [Lewinella sp.]|nr:hypothetical protein [Lewinella sp.]
MKRFPLYVFLLLLAQAGWSQTPSVADLEKQLSEAGSSREKMAINYQLAEALMRSDAKKALDYGKAAHNLAVDLGNDAMAGQSAYTVALAYERQRDTRNTEVWLRTATNFAKKAGDSDLIIQSVDKRSRLATKDNNYRRAYEINQEAFTYFSKGGTSISDLESKYEMQKAQIEKEKRDLAKDKDKLEFDIRNLRLEYDQITTDKSNLEAKQVELIRSNKAKEDEISAKEEELVSISEQKEQAEEKAKERAKEVEALSEEAAKTQLIIEGQRADLAEADLVAANQQKFLYLAGGIAGIVLLLALLFYSRYRAKRRANKKLEEKNRIIETERQRSDELLLNILPAPIASELKETGKAKARKFNEATVLFTDFKNFTGISEALTPEELVEELDKCFKAFDFIISSYPDIEKIKTIGDAYMCASGLSDRRTVPTNIVKAALEMQQFLDEQRQERQRLGKPYFEARIGLHTGPVVAGVVGVKKFAYDIWGDTVNIASRMEANCQPGKINISETTFGLVKYKFDCEYRGKIEAKHKGMIDMYYVKKELVGAVAV